MLYQSLLVVLLTILQCSLSDEVESVVVRLSKPANSDDYSPTASGSYGEGDTVSIDSLGTSIYYCVTYKSIEMGNAAGINVEGVESGLSRGPSDKEASKSYSTYRRYYGTSMNTFASDTNIKVIGTIKDDSGNIISQKSIEFILFVAPPAEAEIVSFIGRYSKPESSSEYAPGSRDAIDDGSMAAFSSSSAIVYFAQKFTNLNTGYRIELVMTGMDSGETRSYSKDITSFESSYRFYYGKTINSFGNNFDLKAELTVYNAENSIVASDELNFDYTYAIE